MSKYKLLSIKKSKKKGKKLVATFKNKTSGRIKKTHFGASGYKDYTMHKNKNRRKRYRTRHKKDFQTGDPTRAGYLSSEILWGKSGNITKNTTTNIT